MSVSELKCAKLLFTGLVVIMLVACSGGGGGSSSTDTDNTTDAGDTTGDATDGTDTTGGNDDPSGSPTIRKVGPVDKNNIVTFGAINFTVTVSDEAEITSAAAVTFNRTTGELSIADGAGVRGYEIKVIHDGGTNTYAYTDAGFIEASDSVGALGTLSWSGAGEDPNLLNVSLYAANGQLIPSSISQ